MRRSLAVAVAVTVASLSSAACKTATIPPPAPPPVAELLEKPAPKLEAPKVRLPAGTRPRLRLSHRRAW